MNKIVSFILCLLLCAGVGGAAYAVYKNYIPNDEPTIENPVENPDEGGNTDSGNNSGGGNTDSGDNGGEEQQPPEVAPMDVPLSVPTNVTSLVESRLTMVGGAQVYFGEDDDSLEPAIRFMCNIGASLLEEVNADENKKFAMLVAPMDMFDKINPDNKTYVDWVKEFEKAGKTVILSEYGNLSASSDDGSSYFRFTLANVLYNNIFRPFVAMGVVIDNTSETPVYKYAAMPEGMNYRTNARSVSQVAGAALNAHALGEATFGDAQVAKLKNYVNMAVDNLNGLETPTDDGSMPTVEITGGNSVSVAVNAVHQLQWKLNPYNKYFVLPARFVSTNTSVATVTASGEIKGVSAGTTTIKMYVAGELHTISVTVTA